jgi:hypothetical protein
MMNILKGRASKLIAVALVVAVSQVYVNADLVRAASKRLADAATGAGPRQAPQGRLTTGGNNAITVNGNSAKTGETIFSGQQLQTPAGTGATVQLGPLGRLDVAPNADATLSFEEGKTNVTVARGCAILTASRGTTGTVQAQGRTETTDPSTGGTIDVCTDPAGAAPVFGQGAAAAAGAGAGAASSAAAGTVAATTVGGGGAGLGTAPALILTAASVGTFALVSNKVINNPCRRGPNPSPGVPRGRNDECRD